MGIGTSLFLIAVGAILKFAVHTSVSGVSLQTVGVILMVVGVVGLLITFIWMASARRRAPVVERERAVVDR
jgi:sulfite exporter TauE/SafE